MANASYSIECSNGTRTSNDLNSDHQAGIGGLIFGATNAIMRLPLSATEMDIVSGRVQRERERIHIACKSAHAAALLVWARASAARSAKTRKSVRKGGEGGSTMSVTSSAQTGGSLLMICARRVRTVFPCFSRM